MATKKSNNTKSNNTKSKNTKSKKEVKEIEITSLEVTRAREYDDIFFFDMILNGVYIYDCRLIEGKNGWFVSFPSKKPAKKGGKWYNHCWAKLHDDALGEICSAVFEMCGVDDD